MTETISNTPSQDPFYLKKSSLSAEKKTKKDSLSQKIQKISDPPLSLEQKIVKKDLECPVKDKIDQVAHNKKTRAFVKMREALPPELIYHKDQKTPVANVALINLYLQERKQHLFSVSLQHQGIKNTIIIDKQNKILLIPPISNEKFKLHDLKKEFKDNHSIDISHYDPIFIDEKEWKEIEPMVNEILPHLVILFISIELNEKNTETELTKEELFFQNLSEKRIQEESHEKSIVFENKLPINKEDENQLEIKHAKNDEDRKRHAKELDQESDDRKNKAIQKERNKKDLLSNQIKHEKNS